ncbi:MAG: hypothetical protein ACKPKO_58780, partial [Candidatus Fonsibacter sp.]
MTDKKRCNPVMPKLHGLSVFADGEATTILATNHQTHLIFCSGQDRTIGSVCVLNPSVPGDRVK